MRRDIAQEHVEAVLHYMESDDRCRSAMLLHYFGEKNTAPCGQCDYCVRHQEQEISDDDRNKIRKAVSEMPQIDLETLGRKTGVKDHKIIETLRRMKDDGEI